MYEDKTLVCKECGKEFIFSAGEQEFYAERGFANEPQRCKPCRMARKQPQRTENGEPYAFICPICGKPDTVNFQPREGGRPLLCRECHAKRLQAPPTDD